MRCAGRSSSFKQDRQKCTVLADLFSSQLFLGDFALTRPTIWATFPIYATNFGLKRFGIDDPWPHLSFAGG
jgi:hypothetical protein